MKDRMDEFKRFVAEQFGYDITYVKSDKPDTFESIFGTSFCEFYREDKSKQK